MPIAEGQEIRSMALDGSAGLRPRTREHVVKDRLLSDG